MKEIVQKWCKTYRIFIKDFTPYQSRLIRGDITVDIYWTNSRYHIIKHPVLPFGPKERGDIKNIEVFLESIFNNF